MQTVAKPQIVNMALETWQAAVVTWQGTPSVAFNQWALETLCEPGATWKQILVLVLALYGAAALITQWGIKALHVAAGLRDALTQVVPWWWCRRQRQSPRQPLTTMTKEGGVHTLHTGPLPVHAPTAPTLPQCARPPLPKLWACNNITRSHKIRTTSECPQFKHMTVKWQVDYCPDCLGR